MAQSKSLEKFTKLLDPASDFADEKKLFGEIADKAGVMRTENEDLRSLKEMM